jgi:nucleotide-binding universal stress UspA family protein
MKNITCKLNIILLIANIIHHFLFLHMAPSVLVLTNFFQAAKRALIYATNFAAPLGARLELLHMRRSTPQPVEALLDGYSTHHYADESMRDENMPVDDTPDTAVCVAPALVHNPVVTAVAKAVQRNQPALIVLGRPEEDEPQYEQVIATALEILRDTPCPLLVVPHEVMASVPPRRILLAVDGDSFTMGEFTAAVYHLFHTFHAQLTVLHVAHHADHEQADLLALVSVLRTGLTMNLPKPDICSVVASHPAEGILAVAQAEEFDAVALIARPRSVQGPRFQRGVIARVMLHSELPILVLPTQQ